MAKEINSTSHIFNICRMLDSPLFVFPLFSRPENGGSGAEVVVPVLIILIIVAVVVIVVFYRRNQYGFRDKVRQLYTGIYIFNLR